MSSGLEDPPSINFNWSVQSDLDWAAWSLSLSRKKKVCKHQSSVSSLRSAASCVIAGPPTNQMVL